MNSSVTVTHSVVANWKQWWEAHAYTRLVVLVDENTAALCYPCVQAALPDHHIVTIRSGELHKNIATCEQIWRALTEVGCDRHSLLLNLGGGVIGDMGGFCAATYKRGIDFVQMPTTLLAQVDASVGGKLGIDFEGFKNHIGVFRQPAAVFIGTEFLATLPERELRAGLAEVIKHCLLDDPAYWHRLRQTEDWRQLNWPEIVEHSVAFKRRVTEADPTEQGHRKVLNLGHTVGHAVETFFLTQTAQPLLHGEAIAVGLIAEGYLSCQYAGLSEEALANIVEYVRRIFPDVALAKHLNDIVPLARQDKKNLGSRIRTVLLAQIGKPRYDQEVTEADLRRALTYYAKTQKSPPR